MEEAEAKVKAKGSSSTTAADKEGGQESKDKDKGKGKGGGGQVGHKDLSKMVMDMNKLLLSHDESITALESVLLTTFILPGECPALKAGKEEGQRYHNKAMSLSKEELTQQDLGPPHVFICLAVLKALAGPTTQMQEGSHKEQLKDLVKRMEDGTHQECTRIVPHFRVSKTFKEMLKVKFYFQNTQDTQCLSWYFQQCSGQEKLGKAPRGKMARDCQRWITAVSK
jgi:hypothetical protein